MNSPRPTTPFLGFGLGLRTPHYPDIEAGAVPVDFFEAISESFMRPGGNPRRMLRHVAERFPLALHGVSLSLGGVDPLNEDYLASLTDLVKRFQPQVVSDHLCWSGHGGLYAHDLLPLPYTEEALAHVASRVLRVQERLGRRILIENVSSYMTFTHSTLTEWQFLSALCEKADCLLLLDVNNIFVSAHNHGFDALEFIAGVPDDRVAQIHLAGHRSRDGLLLDTHDRAVCEGVWNLYEATIARLGPVSTLIEWDADVPPLATLVAEADRARALVEKHHGPQTVAHGERALAAAANTHVG